MVDKKLVKKVKIILEKTGGVSANLRQQKILPDQDWWMFPKYPSITKILPQKIDLELEIGNFVKENMQLLAEKDTYLGIWLNPKTKDYYFDVTTAVDDKKQALEKARKVSMKEGRNIVAIYNPIRDETIFL